MASRKTSTALGWFPHTAATEAAIIDIASARQVALRVRLRNHYWLTEGKPLGEPTIALVQRKMALIDPADSMTPEQVREVLSDHYGFQRTPAGWIIPDLDEARGVAVGSLQAIQERAAAGGRAKAAKAVAQRGGVPANPTPDSTDF